MSTGAPSVTLVGTVVSDPELRFQPNGNAVANVTVACNERRLDKQTNEWVDGEATFLRCTIWGQYAENVAETILKGQRVIVTGSLRVRQYERTDGTKGTSVECNVDEIGPSLRWATAKVTRTGTTGQPQQRQSDPFAERGAIPF